MGCGGSSEGQAKIIENLKEGEYLQCAKALPLYEAPDCKNKLTDVMAGTKMKVVSAKEENGPPSSDPSKPGCSMIQVEIMKGPSGTMTGWVTNWSHINNDPVMPRRPSLMRSEELGGPAKAAPAAQPVDEKAIGA